MDNDGYTSYYVIIILYYIFIILHYIILYYIILYYVYIYITYYIYIYYILYIILYIYGSKKNDKFWGQIYQAFSGLTLVERPNAGGFVGIWIPIAQGKQKQVLLISAQRQIFPTSALATGLPQEYKHEVFHKDAVCLQNTPGIKMSWDETRLTLIAWVIKM